MNFFGFLNNRLKSKGFTLIEILVSLSIVIVLTTLVIANFEWGGYNFALQRSLHVASQQIRNAQEMAFSSKEIGEAVPPGGYGVNFNIQNSITKYILFADNNGDKFYNGEPTDKIIEEFSLEDDVSISGLFISSLATEFLDIVFVPPDPAIYINSSYGGGADFSGDIHFEAANKATGSISVNGVGLIELNK